MRFPILSSIRATTGSAFKFNCHCRGLLGTFHLNISCWVDRVRSKIGVVVGFLCTSKASPPVGLGPHPPAWSTSFNIYDIYVWRGVLGRTQEFQKIEEGLTRPQLERGSLPLVSLFLRYQALRMWPSQRVLLLSLGLH